MMTGLTGAVSRSDSAVSGTGGRLSACMDMRGNVFGIVTLVKDLVSDCMVETARVSCQWMVT